MRSQLATERTDIRIHTDELSPVRLPLALVASLIQLYAGTPGNRVRLFVVCSS
jgi:hypothetical protein